MESAISYNCCCRGRLRGERENDDGRIRGIGFAPGRIPRQIRGQLATGGIDGGLHVAAGAIDIAAEVKLQNHDGEAELADGSHLVDAGNAAKHALERRGYRRGHGVRTRTRQLGGDLNDRISHFGQGGDRKLTVSERARQKQSEGQQGSRDRTSNEWSRNIHRVSFSLFDPA